MTPPSNLSSFASCPACDADFGVPPGNRPPSLYLALGKDRRQWQLSTFARRGKPATVAVASSDLFDAYQIGDVYWICGDGHLFLDHHVHGVLENRAVVSRFESVAMVGAVAAGKSYILLRTLLQDLTPPPLKRNSRTQLLTEVNGTSIEEGPRTDLRREYGEAVVRGSLLDATRLDEIMPRRYLARALGHDVAEQIIKLHTLEDRPTDEKWGEKVRQPIVQRYALGDEQFLVCVADLPGEFFRADTYDDEHRRRTLRKHSSMLWVIDPAVCDSFYEFLPDDEHRDRLVAGSVRPDAKLLAEVHDACRRRSHQQDEIADAIGGEGDFGANEAEQRKLLICFTKADLVGHALQGGRTLDELGEPGAVVTGVAEYLLEISNRCVDRRRRIVDDGVWAGVISDLTTEQYSDLVRSEIAQHVANALVEHYSDHDRLWKLVHTGEEDTIEVHGGQTQNEQTYKITLPTISDHLTTTFTAGEGGLLRQRDLIMSALTCGLLYGLGLRAQVNRVLAQRWRDPRLFLCSPMGSVPTLVQGSTDRVRPLVAGRRFPSASTPSAALTQLKLALLAEGARR